MYNNAVSAFPTERLRDIKSRRAERGVEFQQVPKSANICLNDLCASQSSSHSKILSQGPPFFSRLTWGALLEHLAGWSSHYSLCRCLVDSKPIRLLLPSVSHLKNIKKKNESLPGIAQVGNAWRVLHYKTIHFKPQPSLVPFWPDRFTCICSGFVTVYDLGMLSICRAILHENPSESYS